MPILQRLSSKEPDYQCRRCRRCKFSPWVGNIPWRRKWQCNPIMLRRKSHGQRSLVGYSPWGCRVRHDLVSNKNNNSVYMSALLYQFIPLSSPTVSTSPFSMSVNLFKCRDFSLACLFLYPQLLGHCPAHSRHYKTLIEGMNDYYKARGLNSSSRRTRS